MSKRTILIVSVSQIVSYLIPLLTFPILVKSFDINSYGIWIEASTISSLAVSFAVAGLVNALGVMIVSKPDDADKIYANSLYIFLIVGIVIGAIISLIAPFLNNLTIRQPVGIIILRIVSTIPLINALQTICIQIFRLRQQPFIGATLEISMAAARLIAVVFAAFTKDLVAFSIAYVLLQIITVLPFLLFAYKNIHFPRPSWIIIKETVVHSLNLSLVSQSLWLVQYGDRLLLSILSVSFAVAVYSASYKLCMILVGLGWPYLYALLPALGEKWKNKDLEGLKATVKQSSRGMSLLLIPAVIGLTTTSTVLLRVLATEAFVQGTLLVGMITIGIGIDTLGGNMLYIFFAQGRPEVSRGIYTRAAILNIVANLVAIPLFSYNGAGLTTLLTFGYIFYSLWRKTEMPFTDLYDIGTMGRCLVAGLVMGAWVIATVGSGIVGLSIAIGGGAIIYGVGIIALKVISLDELLAIPRSIIRRIRQPKTA
jgi:O-antigen/teichoic acid export membrane protein